MSVLKRNRDDDEEELPDSDQALLDTAISSGRVAPT